MYFISQLHGKGAEHSIQEISMMPRLWLLLLLFGAAFWYKLVRARNGQKVSRTIKIRKFELLIQFFFITKV